MTQKTIKTFKNEIFSKPPKTNFTTNKINVYHIDEKWSSDILDLKDYGSENNRGFGYILVIMDKSSKFNWTVPLKNKNGQTIKNSFENILISSKRKPNLLESMEVRNFITIFLRIPK